MYNWSVDIRALKKHPKAYAIWKLEQLLNYGLGEEKISEKLARKYWKNLHLDPNVERYIKFLLWPKI